MTRLRRRTAASLAPVACLVLTACSPGSDGDSAPPPGGGAAAAAAEPAGEPLTGTGEPELVADGFGLAEGCLWHGGRLVVSDVTGDVVYALDGQRRQTLQDPSNYANGRVIDSDGRLLQAEHGTRRVVAMAAGQPTVLADTFGGRRLNSPNDVTVAPDGGVLFTDPTFGLAPPYGPAGQQPELDFSGVYRIPPGADRARTDHRPAPTTQRIGVAPDGRTVYVSDTATQELIAVELTSGRRTALGEAVDGLGVDERGRIWATVEGGVAVYQADGQRIAQVDVPEQPTNLCWGGPDGRTLYITTYQSVYSLATATTSTEPAG
jgi:gluconolactonase